MTTSALPELVPILSPGRHRNPRKGACFMEFASWLAGERWSDHPACTHPVLGELARQVNDHVDDETRGRLVVLIPDVVGLTSEDPMVPVVIARAVALTAMGYGGTARQRIAALSLLACERRANQILGNPPRQLSPEVAAALATAPEATQWAREFAGHLGWRGDADFDRTVAPRIVQCGVATISDSGAADAGDQLVALLSGTIETVRELASRESSSPRATSYRSTLPSFTSS